jgi:hypothetical protein
MSFKKFREDYIDPRVQHLLKTGMLFKLKVEDDSAWLSYLGAFESAEERQSHTCNCCKSFIRNFAMVVSLDENGNRYTIWDVNPGGLYQKPCEELQKLAMTLPIEGVYTPVQATFSSDTTRATTPEGQIISWNHFYVKIPQSQMLSPTRASHFNSGKDVFLRGLQEIPTSILQLIVDLVAQGSLRDGPAYINKVQAFLKASKEFNKLPADKRNDWAWSKVREDGLVRFRNEVIGTLAVALSEGEDLTSACLSFNKKVDPANFKKATVPVTPQQRKDAIKLVDELGCEASFLRRPARLGDVIGSEILYANSVAGEVVPVSIFDNIKTTKGPRSKSILEGAVEIGIEKFMKEILPTTTGIKVFLDNQHEGNLFTMFCPTVESPNIFNYNNNFSFTTSGNLAGKSAIAQAVKDQGGQTGVLRTSIMWSDELSASDDSDLDLHCTEPNGERIYFGHKKSLKTGGNLDIDIRVPSSHKRNGHKVVENITFPALNKMVDGVYKFFVNQFSANNSQGFSAEIEVEGVIYSYSYPNAVQQNKNVQIAEVTLEKGKFSIKHLLKESAQSKVLYGLETQEFHQCSLVCLSPNHWGENKVGNKHYMFALKGCKADRPLRTFHTVDLHAKLEPIRKVIDYLGYEVQVTPEGDQLSGLCFNATVRDSVYVEVAGSHKRIMKLIF